jgi:hypothetical protein
MLLLLMAGRLAAICITTDLQSTRRGRRTWRRCLTLFDWNHGEMILKSGVTIASSPSPGTAAFPSPVHSTNLRSNTRLQRRSATAAVGVAAVARLLPWILTRSVRTTSIHGVGRIKG